MADKIEDTLRERYGTASRREAQSTPKGRVAAGFQTGGNFSIDYLIARGCYRIFSHYSAGWRGAHRKGFRPLYRGLPRER